MLQNFTIEKLQQRIQNHLEKLIWSQKIYLLETETANRAAAQSVER